MNIINLINEKYEGNIKLQYPLDCGDDTLPEVLTEILRQSNGINETKINPKTGD